VCAWLGYCLWRQPDMGSSHHPCLLPAGRPAVDSGVLEAELAREQCALLETRTRVVESVAHSHGGSTVPNQFMGVTTTRGPRYVKVAAFLFYNFPFFPFCWALHDVPSPCHRLLTCDDCHTRR
jgi:hypothetical protein